MQPRYVLARLADERPGEAEVVVDPRGLRNIPMRERVQSVQSSTGLPVATAHLSTS